MSWLAKSVFIASVLSVVMVHAGVVEEIDVGLAWSATRTGHPCVDTYGNQQAVGYFNEDHRVKVSQRHLEGTQWAHFVTDIKGAFNDGGGHMMVAVAIDKAGYTHVMGAMHNKPLKYWRSVSPVEVRPDGTCADNPFVMERVASMVGKDERLTYPMFFRDANDDLCLIYRYGGSGSGETIINKLDSTTQTWHRMPTLFKRPHSVYNRRPILGEDGNLHLLFMWRGSPQGHTGHTLAYMKTKDLVNWTTAGGEPVSIPLRHDHKIAVVDPSPQGGGLLNVAYSLGFDSSKRPVIAYNKFVDDKRDAGSGLYVARYEEGGWRRRLIDSEPAERDFTSYYRPVEPLVPEKGVINLACFRMPRAGRGKLSTSGSTKLYVLNEEDLSVTKTVDPSPTYWPDSVYEKEIEPTRIVKELTVEMRPWYSSHSALGFPSGNPDTGCFLRWEYGKSSRLKNPDVKNLPAPGMLRLYEVDRKLIWPKKSEKAGTPQTKGSSQANETDLLAKISHGNVEHLRYPTQQKAPDWARKVFEERLRVLKERIEQSYRDSGRWYYVKCETSDCGDSVWWDEVSTHRVYVTLQGFVGGVENLPHYSPGNQRKAIEFWQSWQNEKNGIFYNPFFVDPENPSVRRTTEGYDPKRYHRRGKDIEKVNQKYLPLVLGALGSTPLYQVEEERRLADDNIGGAVEGIEKALIKGTRGQTIGNQVTRQIWLMADQIDRGRTELIPDYERLMALLLQRFDSRTGLLGKPNFADYVTSANNVKCNARIIGYIGLENYPYRRQLADSLANAFSKSGVKQPGAIRNWSYLATLTMQQTDHRRDDLYTAIGNLVKGFAKGGDAGYCWMSLSTAAAWLNWDIAGMEAFDDPSVSLCYNGVNRPYRSVVGPFGRWVNMIPRAHEETYGAPEFSWGKHGLRARNVVHEKRTVMDIVPASPEDWQKSTDEKGRVVLKRTFNLGDQKIENPYLKAKWNGRMELYLNGVLVKKISGSFPDYCGLHVPEDAANSLKKGDNLIEVKAIAPNSQIMLDVGLIDWK